MREKYQTLLQIVQDTAAEIGLTVQDNNVLSSTNNDTRQLGKFVIATCEELLTKYPWRRSIGDDPWVMKSDESYADEITNDTDIPQIDSRLLKLGARWRYLHSKGLKYNEDFRTYQIRIQTFAFYKNDRRNVNLNETNVTS